MGNDKLLGKSQQKNKMVGVSLRAFRKIILSLLLLCGCRLAPYETTPIHPYVPLKERVGKNITVGLFVDNRFPFWPRKEASSPLVKGDRKQIKDFEPLAVTKEVRIPMGEVRNRLAESLKKSGQFDKIINPPNALVGNALTFMLNDALETSDYLLVGEINEFHTTNLGRNDISRYTLPLDISIFGLPNLVVVLVTGSRSLLLTGGIFPAHTAECTLSMSITVYSVETGNPVTTVQIREKALVPIDVFDVYGDLNNAEDDWIDLGRRLGEVALANACNKAVNKLAQVIKQNIEKENVR